MITKLNQIQYDYLRNSMIWEQELLSLKLKINKNNASFAIDTDEATADEIRDWANDQLQIKGFDINYNLTDEGKILESLIDAFYKAV